MSTLEKFTILLNFLIEKKAYLLKNKINTYELDSLIDKVNNSLIDILENEIGEFFVVDVKNLPDKYKNHAILKNNF